MSRRYMRPHRREVAPKYLHDRRPGEAIPGCECDACRGQANEDHYAHMAHVFGLREEDGKDRKGGDDLK